MTGPANQRSKIAHLEVTLDGEVLEIPESQRVTLVAVYSYLEGIALRRNALLHSLKVDGIPIRLEAPIVPLRQFRKVEAVAARFDEFGMHLVPSLQLKVRQLHNRAEVAAELAIINEWPVVQRLWWDLLPDLKEPFLILNLLARLPVAPGQEVGEYSRVLNRAIAQLNLILLDMDKVLAAQDPLLMSDILEHSICPWLYQLQQTLAWKK